MAKKNDSAKNEAREAVRVLTDDHKKRIRAIIENKNKMKMDQEAISEDVKAVAELLGLSKTTLNEIIKLIQKEEQEGGAIKEKMDTLDLTKQVLNYNEYDEPDSSTSN